MDKSTFSLYTLLSFKNVSSKGVYGIKILTQLSLSYTNILTYLFYFSLKVSEMLLAYFCRLSLQKRSEIHASFALEVKMFQQIEVTYPVNQSLLHYLMFCQFPQNNLK